MKSVAWMLAAALFIAGDASAGKKEDKLECEKVKEQIRVIQAKMRNGYTASQGIRYDEKLRKLRDRRYRVCR